MTTLKKGASLILSSIYHSRLDKKQRSLKDNILNDAIWPNKRFIAISQFPLSFATMLLHQQWALNRSLYRHCAAHAWPSRAELSAAFVILLKGLFWIIQTLYLPVGFSYVTPFWWFGIKCNCRSGKKAFLEGNIRADIGRDNNYSTIRALSANAGFRAVNNAACLKSYNILGCCEPLRHFCGTHISVK